MLLNNKKIEKTCCRDGQLLSEKIHEVDSYKIKLNEVEPKLVLLVHENERLHNLLVDKERELGNSKSNTLSLEKSNLTAAELQARNGKLAHDLEVTTASLTAKIRELEFLKDKVANKEICLSSSSLIYRPEFESSRELIFKVYKSDTVITPEYCDFL